MACQVASYLKTVQYSRDGARLNAAFVSDRLNRWPAMPIVVSVIG